MEEARQRALELIYRYDVAASPGKSSETTAKVTQTIVGSHATPGFEVLNLRSSALRAEVDNDEYRDLKNFLKYQKVRSIDKVFKERESRERGDDRDVESAKKKLLIRGMQQHKLNLLKAKEIQLHLAGTRKVESGRSMQHSKDSSKFNSPKVSPREPHSPRKSLPSILSPGHHTLVAWQGVPESLRKAYFDEEDARDEEGIQNSEVDDKESRKHSIKTKSKFNAQLPMTAVNKAKNQMPIVPTIESHEMQLGRVRGFLDVHQRIDTNLREVENIDFTYDDGLRMTEKRQRSKNQQNSPTQESAYVRQKAWLEQRALQYGRERKKKLKRNQTSQAIHTMQSSPLCALTDKKERVSRLLSKSSSCTKLVGYTELCKRARQQVLSERKSQLEILAKRRHAAQVIKRALSRYVDKLHGRRVLAEEMSRIINRQEKCVSKLQAVFRGHAARVGVQALVIRRTRAALTLQRLVRNSRSWRRAERERNHELRNRQQSIQEEAAAKSDAEKEHFEWIHRVLSRTQKESNAETRLSILSSTPENVRNWVVNAPTMLSSSDLHESDSARELVLHQGNSSRKGSEKDHARLPSSVPKLRLFSNKDSLELSDHLKSHLSPQQSQPDRIGSGSFLTEIDTYQAASGDRQMEQPSAKISTREGHGPVSKQPCYKKINSASLTSEEFAAMNTKLEAELSRRVVNVHGRMSRLQNTINTISHHEQQLPDLRFRAQDDKSKNSY